MTRHYWVHSAPTDYHPDHDDDGTERIPDTAHLTTDRDGTPWAACPDGTIVQRCPGRHPGMVPGQPVWCRGCATRIEADLDRLPDLAAGLPPGQLNAHTPGAARGGQKLRGTHSLAATPSPSPAWDTIDALLRDVGHLEDTLRLHLGHSVPRRHTLTDACGYLTANLSALLSSPWAAKHGKVVTRWARTLTQVTGTDRLTHHLPGECMVCDRRGRLHRADGDELVKCGACGATWAWDHYDRLVKGLAHNERAVGRVAS